MTFMKSIGLSLALLAFLTGWVGATERPPQPTHMTDPILGLEYSVRSVLFDQFPNTVTWKSKAPKLRDGVNWIFASFVDPKQRSDEYLIVAGMSQTWLDTEPATRGDYELTSGTVLLRRAGKYRVVGSYDKLYGMLGLSEKVVDGLLQNAVARIVRAFGGKEALEAAWGRSSGVVSLEPALVRAFTNAGVSLSNLAVRE